MLADGLSSQLRVVEGVAHMLFAQRAFAGEACREDRGLG